MKDAIITVKTENFDGKETESFELISEGKFGFRDGSYLIKYGDGCLGGDLGDIETVIKVSTAGTATITRSGAYNSRFTLQKGKRCESLYSTPYGQMSMGFYGEEIKSNLTENGGRLTLIYTVDCNKAQINKNTINITVKDVK